MIIFNLILLVVIAILWIFVGAVILTGSKEKKS